MQEIMVNSWDEIPVCKCGSAMKKVFVSSGGHRLPDMASWIPSVLDVVDKDSTKPHVVEFRKNPTRENYKKWMKGEGIRPLEPGTKYKREVDLSKVRKEVVENIRKRNRIEVG